MRKTITVINNFKGYHKYAGAPEKVAFLRQLHRHIFNVRTTIEVFNNDRDVEFYILQDELERLVNRNFLHTWESYLDGIHIDSCEQLAEFIYNYMHNAYPNRFVRVEVGEDQENYATVED